MSERRPLQLEPPSPGALFVISGPSGVGKSTLVRHALAELPGLRLSVSCTTRAPRTGEQHGEDYYFVSRADFERGIERNRFLEHARVYGELYGTPRSELVALSRGESILLDVDVQGARQVRAAGEPAVHIFILPPDLQVLEVRLRQRATDSEATIQRRMRQAHAQLAQAGAYDYVLVNRDLHTAHRVFQGVLLAELHRIERRQAAVQRVLGGELPDREQDRAPGG